MRVTRAAQRAQQDVEEPIEAHEDNERVLKDIEPNTSPAAQIEELLPAKTPAKTPAKKGRGKGAKKGAKNKKAKAEEEELAQPVEEAVGEAVEEAEPQAAAGPKDEDADEKLAQEHEDEATQVLEVNEPPKDPQAPAPRLTRRQLAKLEEEALSRSQRAPSTLAGDAENTDTTDKTAEKAPEELVAEPKEDTVAEADVTPTTHEEPTEASPESPPKPVRLTRRQQAKLEEELKAQAEQQALQPEPTEEEVLQQIVEEAEAQAAVEHEEEILEEPNFNSAEEFEESVVPVAATDERPLLQEEIAAEPRTEEAIEVEAVEESQTDEAPEVTEVDAILDEKIEAAPATPTEADFATALDAQLEEPVSDQVMPSVEISSEAEPKMLSAEKPFEGSMSTPVKSPTSIRRTSRSPSKSPMRIEESISAIDRLEEDLEDMGRAIPDLDHSEDEKTRRGPKSTKNAATPLMRGKTPSNASAKTPAKTPARTTAKVASKTPSKTLARESVPIKASVAATVQPPSRISRVPSAAPKSVKPSTTLLARASIVRTAPSKDVMKPSTDTADYLASKRRPISLSFPTPPPPPKGKAPTKPTFQLSSDNVAARLKAQKEERLKREVEGPATTKQRPISMPPPPRSTKPPTVPNFQLPGEAAAARLKAQKEVRLKRMEENGGALRPNTRPISMPPPPKSTKPATVPNFQLPGEATAAKLKAQKEERLKRMEEAVGDKPLSRPINMPPPLKSTKAPTKANFQLPGEATAARLKAQKEERLKRMEEAEAAKKAALAAATRKPLAHRPRESLLVRDAPGVSIPPPSNSDPPQRSTSLASKRSSIIGASASRSTSTSSANRNSLLLAAGTKSTVTLIDAAALKVKGKQVFNRDRMEKEAMERERRDKEEAAKRARAEAAERGRIASREWAERQRMKMVGQ
ncbi:hypothetical protein EJ07DRAFT_180138 [Lizonia empirigonia]|nr:hypothetical protein EJ07DRAFT_180138 [Lizonia empirigonia]